MQAHNQTKLKKPGGYLQKRREPSLLSNSAEHQPVTKAPRTYAKIILGPAPYQRNKNLVEFFLSQNQTKKIFDPQCCAGHARTHRLFLRPRGGNDKQGGRTENSAFHPCETRSYRRRPEAKAIIFARKTRESFKILPGMSRNRERSLI